MEMPPEFSCPSSIVPAPQQGSTDVLDNPTLVLSTRCQSTEVLGRNWQAHSGPWLWGEGYPPGKLGIMNTREGEQELIHAEG